MLKNKNFLLGVTGGIAAYKTAILVRLLVKNGANVKVVMTPMAKEFISPLTLATLSKNPILVDFYNPENGDWNSHVDLGLWADAYIIAPATANTIGKMANAIADNLLITTYLSAKCPVFVAPAMDLDMFLHPANQESILKLKSYGNIIIEPDEGELASGLSGKGRMAEPERILSDIQDYFKKKKSLKNKKILISAGPTHEKIDAVRFIGNYSSGKMGYGIAKECLSRGAKVKLVAGPNHQEIHHSNLELIKVKTAQEMFDVCSKDFKSCDAAVFAAAVADFTPIQSSDEKIKRKTNNINIKLKPTKDIALEAGKVKSDKQVFIGFALEKSNAEKNAQKKLESKNLNAIVLNSITEDNECFNSDFNKVTIIDNKKNKIQFSYKKKNLIAKDIVDYLENELEKNK